MQLDLKSITAMAYDRPKWVDKVRNTLNGALGEYAQIAFARASKVGEGFVEHWDKEVKTHFKTLADLFDPKEVKSKTKFDRVRAFGEAYKEATLSKDQITAAKNKIDSMVTTKKQRVALYKAVAPVGDMLKDMVQKYGKGLKIKRG